MMQVCYNFYVHNNISFDAFHSDMYINVAIVPV